VAELRFVGLGLGDEQDLSRRAWGVLARTPRLFADGYTSVWGAGAFERLAAELGRPVVPLDRAAVESAEPILAALDRGEDVALLVVGDPFAATTHVALRLAAEARGHAWTYLPNASVLTAVPGWLGLQPYRFGRTVSLPLPEPGFAPTSPLDGIAANRAAGLHTLVLLDLRPDEGRFLRAEEALRLFAERDPAGHRWPRAAAVAVVARVGTAEAQGWYGPPADLASADFGPPLHALVVPAPELHFEEAAAIARFVWPRPVR
jgi:diphthine synthase